MSVPSQDTTIGSGRGWLAFKLRCALCHGLQVEDAEDGGAASEAQLRRAGQVVELWEEGRRDVLDAGVDLLYAGVDALLRGGDCGGDYGGDLFGVFGRNGGGPAPV